MVRWGERWQVPLYVVALGTGCLLGFSAPRAAPALGASVTPVLGVLLFVTFLGIPLVRLKVALKDHRFLLTVLLVNFVVAPGVVFLLSRFVIADTALVLGVLLVLLTPCIDYVIVFTGLAGGSQERLLAATPMLMVVQLLLLPLYLLLFAGPETAGLIEVAPFVQAFITLIVIPLALAAGTQALAGRAVAGADTSISVGPPSAPGAIARTVIRHAGSIMVPLMMVTLVVVVASQVVAVAAQLPRVVSVVPLYIAYIAVMLVVGVVAAKVARLEVPAARAVVFSGITRNSLVVLPLALALPAELALVPLVVVTQTLVELVGMALLVKVVPRVLPQRFRRDELPPEHPLPHTTPPPIVYR